MLNQQQPATINMLSPLGFKFVINKLPNVNYMVQSVEIPQVTMRNAEMATPFVTVPFPGDHIQYSPLSIVFKIDENMINYIELYKWFKGLGFPHSFDESREIYDLNSLKQSLLNAKGKGAFSDITLSILNSDMNTNIKVTFFDAFPVGISQISFDSRNTDVKYIDATATFMYRSFDIESLYGSTVW